MKVITCIWRGGKFSSLKPMQKYLLDSSHKIQNIAYFELLRREFSVSLNMPGDYIRISSSEEKRDHYR